MKLRRGDFVMIQTGRDKGKTGEIKKVFPNNDAVIVDGLNKVKKSQKPTSSYPQGGIIEKSLPIKASNVNPICPSCKKVTRIGYTVTKDGKKRICKKCGEQLS